MCTIENLVLLLLILWLSFSIRFWRNLPHKRKLYKHCGINFATLEFWQMTFNNSLVI